MKKCLVLRLAGPMQSWGTQSRFTERDTGREPSKSGVIGMLCAAMGIDRADEEKNKEWLPKLSALRMGVRIDREGVFSRDFHTAGGGKINGGEYGVPQADQEGKRTVVSNRYFLADAEFHVALESEDDELLVKLHAALCNPRWPLYLGRKSFVPAPPVCCGIRDGTMETVLKGIPWRRRTAWETPPHKLRIVLECNVGEGAVRMDVPLSFENGKRSFTVRHVSADFIEGLEVQERKEDENVPVATDP